MILGKGNTNQEIIANYQLPSFARILVILCESLKLQASIRSLSTQIFQIIDTKMSLYPSLEDMKVDKMAQAQHQYAAVQASHPAVGHAPIVYPHQAPAPGGSLYPSLAEYMGLDLSNEAIQQNMPLVAQQQQVAVPSSGGQVMVAPVTGNSVGLRRAEIKQGMREVVLCKDADGLLGVRIRHVNNGLFVALVKANSPAALGGLRFGDQIVELNGHVVAGWSNEKAHKVIKDADPQRLTMIVRDRPFERTITLQKDSNGFVGFVFNNGKINKLVKDSSAARNGLLTEHHLLEVDGRNVVGLTNNQIGDIIDSCGRSVTVTVMPSYIYEHIIKCMGNSLVKKLMDHSIPDL